MDSLEFNKVFAALLTAGIAFVGSGLIGEALVHPHRLEHSVLKIEGAEGGAPAPEAPKGPVVPIANLLATADVGAGESSAKKLCTSCHSFNEGGKAMVGPNLYNVVGAPHGHMEGFAYSAALKSKEGPWNYDELNQWLTNPRGYAPGTKMAFAGIANDKQRADVIAYLRSLSHDPKPLPAPEAVPAAAPAGAAPSNAAPAAASGGTPVPPQAGPNAPTSGVLRPQGGQVTGAPAGNGTGTATQGAPGAMGQTSQPAPNMNQSQTQQNQSEQTPQAAPSSN